MICTCPFNIKNYHSLHAMWRFQVLCVRFDIQRGIHIRHPQGHIKAFYQQNTASFISWSFTFTQQHIKRFDFTSLCHTRFITGDTHQNKDLGIKWTGNCPIKRNCSTLPNEQHAKTYFWWYQCSVRILHPPYGMCLLYGMHVMIISDACKSSVIFA